MKTTLSDGIQTNENKTNKMSAYSNPEHLDKIELKPELQNSVFNYPTYKDAIFLGALPPHTVLIPMCGVWWVLFLTVRDTQSWHSGISCGDENLWDDA